MRIIFMGTPEFAIPILNKLYESENQVIAVISQPDREKDKKGNLLCTAVKRRASELGLQCFQFEKISVEGVNILAELKPDLIVTAAYGQMLSRQVLDIPTHGIFNVHASILPKYRGSSPIQAALLNGEKVTGITIMKTEEGMDTGDILNVKSIEIQPNDNAETLQNKLSSIGGDLLLDTIELLKRNKLTAVKQDNSLATKCKKIVKTDGLIDWSLSAESINNKIRAYSMWPTAYFIHDNKNIKVYCAKVINCDCLDLAQSKSFTQAIQTIQNSTAQNAEFTSDLAENAKVGEVVKVSKNELIVACGSGLLTIEKIQAPGKRILAIEEFLRGYCIKKGEIL